MNVTDPILISEICAVCRKKLVEQYKSETLQGISQDTDRQFFVSIMLIENFLQHVASLKSHFNV